MTETVVPEPASLAPPHRLPIRAALATLFAAALVVVAGPASAAGLPWWLSYAIYVLGAAISGVGALVVAYFLLRKRAPRVLLLGALVAGLLAALIPGGSMLAHRSAAPIHDISTDTADPPQFGALLAVRGAGANEAAYDGPETAAQQRIAYPDLAGVLLSQPPRAVFDRALTTARERGWLIVAANPAAGLIEAVATTRWWGLKDDIVIRVRADGNGSRIDMRSKSRVGRSDDGRNAARVRDFTARLRP